MAYDRYSKFSRVGDFNMSSKITSPTVDPDLTSGSLTVGERYVVKVSGSADWTNVGAADNNVGTEFEATGTTPTSWTGGTLTHLKLGGDETLVSWFPNAPGSALRRGSELFFGITKSADRDLWIAAADGQSLSITATWKEFDNGNPSTGNVVHQKADAIVWTKDVGDNFDFDTIKSPTFLVPGDFDPDTLRLKLNSIAGLTLSELRLFAVC